MSYSYYNNQTPVHHNPAQDEYYDPYSEAQRAPHATYDQGGYRDDYYDASAQPVTNNVVPGEKDQPFNASRFSKEAGHTATQCVDMRYCLGQLSYGLISSNLRRYQYEKGNLWTKVLCIFKWLEQL